MDYWKYLYSQKKKQSKNKASSKKATLKTIRITYKISEHDLEVRHKQAIKFAKANSPLKVTLMLKWREHRFSELAIEKMNEFISLISDIYTLEWRMSRSGSTFSAMFKVKPISKKK